MKMPLKNVRMRRTLRDASKAKASNAGIEKITAEIIQRTNARLGM
jgi:hypothetical protein